MNKIITILIIVLIGKQALTEDVIDFEFINSTNFNTESCSTMIVGDVRKNIISLSGTIIRIKLTGKYLLTQVTPSAHIVHLFAEPDRILGVFDSSGFDAINSIPDLSYNQRKKYYYLYAYIPDAAMKVNIAKNLSKARDKQAGRASCSWYDDMTEHVVVIIGRTKKTGMMNTYSYAW